MREYTPSFVKRCATEVTFSGVCRQCARPGCAAAVSGRLQFYAAQQALRKRQIWETGVLSRWRGASSTNSSLQSFRQVPVAARFTPATKTHTVHDVRLCCLTAPQTPQAQMSWSACLSQSSSQGRLQSTEVTPQPFVMPGASPGTRMGAAGLCRAGPQGMSRLAQARSRGLLCQGRLCQAPRPCPPCRPRRRCCRQLWWSAAPSQQCVPPSRSPCRMPACFPA